MRLRIEGHAIVSANGCIADAAGQMPESLRNEADWIYFQDHLDAAAVVVAGRKGHEAHPNKPGRCRLVFTTTAGTEGFRRVGDVSFLDPARFNFHEAIQRLAPEGGIIAVTGGTSVFDWFADRQLFTAFHLGQVEDAILSDGRPLFSGAIPARQRLLSLGLMPKPVVLLDPDKGVSMEVFESLSPPESFPPEPSRIAREV